MHMVSLRTLSVGNHLTPRSAIVHALRDTPLN